jgi:hypothetical protein
MFSLANWPHKTIGHIFLAVVAAQNGLLVARFAERRTPVVGTHGVVFCLCVFDFVGPVVRGAFHQRAERNARFARSRKMRAFILDNHSRRHPLTPCVRAAVPFSIPTIP